MGEWMYIFAYSAMYSEWSALLPVHLTPREIVFSSHCLGGWMEPGSRSGQYGEVKILDSTGTGTLTPRLSSPVDSRNVDYRARILFRYQIDGHNGETLHNNTL
jgi:hypothetical protein